MLKNKFKKRLLTMLTVAAMMLVFALPAMAVKPLDTDYLPGDAEATVYADGSYPTLSMADAAMDGIGRAVLDGSDVEFTLPVKPIVMGNKTGYIVGLVIPEFGTLGTEYTVTMSEDDPYTTANVVISGVDPDDVHNYDSDTGSSSLYDVTFTVAMYQNGVFYGYHPMPAADIQLDIQPD